MSLPHAAPRRQLKHRRNIEVQVFVRGGGPLKRGATISAVQTGTARPKQGLPQAGFAARWTPCTSPRTRHGGSYGHLGKVQPFPIASCAS